MKKYDFTIRENGRAVTIDYHDAPDQKQETWLPQDVYVAIDGDPLPISDVVRFYKAGKEAFARINMCIDPVDRG